ncbi:MAG: glycosyltransferase [Planctomycetota bacterium]
MRVHVLTSLFPSREAPFEGIFAARKWSEFAARGHDVRVVAPVPWAPRVLAPLLGPARARAARTERRGASLGVEAVRPRYLHVPKRGAGNARSFARVGAPRVLEGAPDAVVIDYAWPGAAAVEEVLRAGVPCVVNGRGSDVLQVQGLPSLRAELAGGLARASALTAVSQDLLDAMVALSLEAGGAAETPAVLTPNGVDGDRFAPGDRVEARGRLGQATDGELVLVVGHLIERKDPLLALRAFVHAARPGGRLVFVGRGPLEGAVAAEAERHGVDVQLVGERPPEELADWYRAADLMLLTSSREGRPNVVLEALSCGCPVVATDAGGTAEVLPDHGRMLVIDRDPGTVAAKLTGLLDAPPAPDTLRASVAELSWGASIDALEGLLSSLIEARRSTGTASDEADTTR